ncbi:DUF6527 family protein [Saccharicrinis sp. 156]|uniref:DUF6527 family protein n=1 Tax=Saccharicrinis sp. 156 TaxID=3417574 RepID=UPI003D326099
MRKKAKFKFVETIPDFLKENVVYITTQYNTAVHKCMCGCGNEVVTPITPHDWELIYNGESITLYPSIGNWNFDCQSHYWIKNNEIVWAEKWSKNRIELNRRFDKSNKDKFHKIGKTKKSAWKQLLSYLNLY